ncbi:MAG TPA: hypothetical protein VI895_05130 [Bdellovibrionota bacterium]|nr:hypothetical protein [Bdellovibrionota bacterium]
MIEIGVGFFSDLAKVEGFVGPRFLGRDEEGSLPVPIEEGFNNFLVR